MQPHGISGLEIERASGAVRFVEIYCQGRRELWWLTPDAGTYTRHSWESIPTAAKGNNAVACRIAERAPILI